MTTTKLDLRVAAWKRGLSKEEIGKTTFELPRAMVKAAHHKAYANGIDLGMIYRAALTEYLAGNLVYEPAEDGNGRLLPRN